MTDKIRVWCIGMDRTEYYAAHSEEEMRQWYIALVGETTAMEDFDSYFEEVPDTELDREFDFNEDGTIRRTTWRQLIDEVVEFPRQLSTSYS